jgi:[ribosomal protein S5]-alanine N-acetyltransferase
MFKLIKLPRVTLRLITHKHGPSLFAILNHPLVAQYNDYPIPLSNRDIKQLIQDDICGYYQGEMLRLAIEHNNTGQLLGCCGLYKIDQASHSAYIGFELHPDHWHQGIMSEVLVAFIDKVQTSYPIKHLFAEVNRQNIASHKLLSKLGFTLTRDCLAVSKLKSNTELWCKPL